MCACMRVCVFACMHMCMCVRVCVCVGVCVRGGGEENHAMNLCSTGNNFGKIDIVLYLLRWKMAGYYDMGRGGGRGGVLHLEHWVEYHL